MRKICIFSLTLFILLFSFLALAKKEKEEDVEIRELSYYLKEDKIYGKVYIPKDGIKRHKAIIMTHDFNMDSDSFDINAMYFARKGYLCYVFDFRGDFKGRSSKSFEDVSILTYKEDLKVVIDNLKEEEFIDKDNIYFLGEGMGGFVGAITLPEYNDIIRAAIFYYPAFNMREYAHFSKDDKSSDNYILNVKVSDKFINDLLLVDPYEEVKKYYGDIYILHGENDEVTPVSISYKITSIKENAILDVVYGQGHDFSSESCDNAREKVFQFISNYD